MNKNKKNSEQNIYILIINVFFLVCFLFYAFTKNQDFLLYSIDGTFIIDQMTHQFKWGLSSPFGFTNNLFQSLGNVYFPVNVNVIPAYLLSLIIHSGELGKVTSYVIFSLESFLAIYIFAVGCRFQSTCAIIAGWLFVLLSFPIVGNPELVGYFSLSPHHSTGMAEILIVILFLSRIGHAEKLSYFFYMIGILLILAHCFISHPGILLLSSPLLTLFGIACILSMSSRKKMISSALTMAGLVILLGIGGFFHYFIGLFKYAAPVFFPEEHFNHRQSFDNVSIFFQNYPQTMNLGIVLVPLAILGAGLDFFNQDRFRKNFSRMFVLYLFILLFLGSVDVICDLNWRGPAPLHFEMVIWPLYCIYATYFFLYVCKKIFYFVNNNFLKLFKWKSLYILCLPILIFCYYLFYTLKNDMPTDPIPLPYPQSTPHLIKILKKEIGLEPSSVFRGRVASFYGQKLEKTNWFEVAMLSIQQLQNIGNDLIFLGFTTQDIPCFFEYNPHITPLFYQVTKKFLAYPQDTQMRTVMVLRKVDSKILRLLGVRFFVTDARIKTDAQLRYQENPTAFLYELENVNIGQYSPTKTIVLSDGRASLDTMGQSDFNPEQSVIVHEKISENLVPATESKMIFEKGGAIKVSSRSEGSSLLVLPIEYSHCFDLVNEEQQYPVKMLRVNLLQIGLLFNRELNVSLKYFTGPGHNSRCRLKDIVDAENFHF